MRILGRDISLQSIGLAAANELRSIENPDNPISDYIGGTINSGIDPNRYNARSLSIVYTAIRIISEDFASLPFRLYQQKGGYYEPLDHDLNYMLDVKPNANQNAFIYKETKVGNLYYQGNAYTHINFNGRGGIDSLDYIDPSDIYPFYDAESGNIFYKRPNQRTLLASEVVHVPFLSFSNKHPRSLGPLDILRDTVEPALNSRNHTNSIHKNGAFPSIVLEHPASLSESAQKRLKKSIQANNAGSNNAGKLIVAEEGMQVKPMQLSPADVELLSTQKWLAEELLRPFRVPAHMAQNLERSTNNNIEHQSLEYVMYCLRPLAVRFEAEYNNKLLSRADYEKGYRFKVNLRALLRGDINTQTDHLNRMVVAGVMSRNEARDFLGLPSKDGLDEMLIPVNLFNKDNEKDGGETESKSYSEKILSDIVRSTSN